MQLTDMTWPAVQALDRSTPVVFPVAALEQHGPHMPLFTDSLLLAEVVRSSDKQRFAFSADGLRIRANQGHSIDVALGLEAAMPPDVLFHGTASRVLAAILSTGLDKRQRHHVHLTHDLATAMAVGRRYGAPVVLEIDAARMHADGHAFHRSANGVWLVEHVPPACLKVHDIGSQA